MVILLINYEYPPIGAGAANATRHIAHSLLKMGDRPIVLTARYKDLYGRRDESGVVVYRCASLRSRKDRSNIFEMCTFLVGALFAVIPIINRERAQGCIVFFSLPCGPVALAGKLLGGLPYVVSLRGGDVPGTERNLALLYCILAPLRRAIMRSALACVANSPGLKKLSELHDSIKVRVIPNGVDTDYFKPSQRKSGSIFKFLFVGRFQGQKNLFWLLDRIEAVTLESSRKFEVHLVGAGPAEMHLRKRAVDRNIGDVVVWHTWCDRANLLIYYQNANCLLNPSLYEGMPNTVLEAMACGLPVIASNVMGNDLCITQGVDGFLFDLHDDRKFAQLMGFFLEKPLEAERLGSNARKKAVEMFTWDSTASQYRRLFSKSAPDIGMLPAPV